jgi:homocysteine S-methyltransferase
VDGAIEIAARVTGKPVVVYPNSGETWDAGARTWAGRSTFATEEVRGWQEAGARLIGGCCRVGPEAITSISGALRAS